ncbi:metalloregulator ArsR/SmtB family transcription factor, partial [Streptomyces sp. P17]|uniref:metalloregulator ArsR/SmtB family transcription factor n=1 Tax=Streptomyces sp. P17 TaxID=3074716 RepID=UPI0028F3E2AF
SPPEVSRHLAVLRRAGLLTARRQGRSLARGTHTTGELAHAWELSPPEVSRHLAVLRRAGLLTARRQGRYVRYSLELPDLTTLGTDLLTAVLR